MKTARKVLIIEDEKHIADNLEQLLKRVEPAIEVSAKTGSVQESVDWLHNNTPDLIFLDIQLSDGLSFVIFQQVEVTAPIIFTTAYDQYALRAFKLNSIDYLLKPINEEDLQQSLNKLDTLQQQGNQIDFEALSRYMQRQQPEYQKRFMVYAGRKIKAVETESIAWFFSMEKQTFLTTDQNQTYPMDYSLDKIETLVDPDKFFRINRRYLVQIDAIKEMHLMSKSRIQVTLQPPAEEKPMVSLSKTAGFRRWLNQ